MKEQAIEQMIEAEAGRHRIEALASRNCGGLAQRCAAYRGRLARVHILAAALTMAGLTFASTKAVAQPTCHGLAGDIKTEEFASFVDTTLLA